MFPEKIYFEPDSLHYELGQKLKEKYSDREWIPIKSHNNIPELRENPNSAFPAMKRLLIIGIRKTHKYEENHKVSDFLVPFTSSGCSAMCLYCYLVCNYNKCSYLRLFVNREQMMKKLMETAAAADRDLCFEIGSNSDLILENIITENLPYVIETFSRQEKGFLTFPTKFDRVEPLLSLDHKGRIIFRMSVNPEEIIKTVEFGTSPLKNRVSALNKMAEAGYKTGLLIAPVVLTENYQEQYSGLITFLADMLSDKVKKHTVIEIIFMTYSFVHNAINTEAFPDALQLYDKAHMTGRGRGKYCYRDQLRAEAEEFLRQEIRLKLGGMPILYIV